MVSSVCGYARGGARVHAGGHAMLRQVVEADAAQALGVG